MQYSMKYIENNLVWNHDGECFAYYELVPYNYSFLSVEQKQAVHDAFRQLIAQNRDGKIHALQISTESSIRAAQERSKTHASGKLWEVALRRIDGQTDALVSMIGENQVDYRFYIGFKLLLNEQDSAGLGQQAANLFSSFLRDVNHNLMGDFASMPNDEILRYQKMEKLLESKISRRFKVRRLDKNDFGYLLEHLYGRSGTAYEDYEFHLPKKKLKGETIVKRYDLIKPTRCLLEEHGRYLHISHDDSEVYSAYFTISDVVGELDFPSSEIFYYQQQQFTFPVDTSMNVEIIANKKALSTVRNKKKELKDFDVTVDEGMQGEFIVNTAVLHDGEDTTPLPDAGVQIDKGEADPIVSKSANVDEAEVGDMIAYTITVKNGDKATAPWRNVVVYDTLPAGVQLIGNVYLDGKVALHKLSGNALSVLVGDLAAGESMTVTFDVQVLDEAAGTALQNSVVVSGDNGSGTATDDGVTVPEVEPQNPTDPTGFYVTKDVDKTVVNVSKGAADEQKTATFTITVGNNGKETWKNVVLKDTLDTSVVTPVLQDNVYVDGVLNSKWSFANKVFTLELGDIAPGASHEIKLTVLFKADAGGKTYVNYVTGAGDNGNATGQSPEVEIISSVDDPVTDIHYLLFAGYADGKWRPSTQISLQEACTVAYRLIANGGNTWLERGTVTVPDYEYTIPEETKYFVSIGVLPASAFDTTKLTEGEDYEITFEVSENGYLRIWATAAQLNTLVKYVTGANAGVSGDVSRLTFAKVICQLTGRDTSPDTTGYSGNIQYFPDVTSSVDLVTEVSHEHDYMLDADGNEYWI